MTQMAQTTTKYSEIKSKRSFLSLLYATVHNNWDRNLQEELLQAWNLAAIG